MSKVMVNAETWYSRMEQTTLDVKSAALKLYSYFQAHQVIVLTNQPLRSILHKPDLFERMMKWDIELSEFGIKYQPRLALKGQVIANFIDELPEKPSHSNESPSEGWWILHVDGASRASGSGVGMTLQSPTG